MGNYELNEAAKVANLYGFDKFKTNYDGEIIVYRVDDFGAVGRVYIGVYVREGNLYIAPYESGGAKNGVDCFYSGQLPYEDEEDENGDLVYAYFDVVQFAKEKIKEYFINNF